MDEHHHLGTSLTRHFFPIFPTWLVFCQSGHAQEAREAWQPYMSRMARGFPAFFWKSHLMVIRPAHWGSDELVRRAELFRRAVSVSTHTASVYIWRNGIKALEPFLELLYNIEGL